MLLHLMEMLMLASGEFRKYVVVVAACHHGTIGSR